jgi:type IV pilus assembly protein PilM
MSFFSTKETAFGLDISDQTLRLIQFYSCFRKNRIQFYNEIKLPSGCVIDGQIKQEEAFIEHFKKLIKTKHGKGKISKEAVIVLPEKETFLKTIIISIPVEKELEEVVINSISESIPLETSEIHYDWQIISQNENEYQILVAASPREVINNYISLFKRIGITVSALEPEAVSINRVLMENNNDKKTQIVIDIGKNRTGLFLYDGKTIKFTTHLPISGDKIDQIISQSLDLNLNDAEKTKLICGLDENRSQGAILEIMKPTIKELSQKISSSIEFYQNNYQDATPIESIILCGGGANTLGIGRAIYLETEIKTELSDPFKIIKNPNKTFFTENKSQSFVTALGLGLRGISPSSFYDKY